MTKEYFLRLCTNQSDGFTSVDTDDLNKFFDSNAVIHKGETLQYLTEDGSYVDIFNLSNDVHKYRIKPAKPVYEWQWVYKHSDMDFFKTLVTNGVIPKAYFSSEKEARLHTSAERVWKLEETKRVRQ